MNKFITSAIKILEEVQKPLHTKEITRLALEQGILETDGKTPEASMSTAIILNIRNKGKKANFVKVGPSTYELNKEREIDMVEESEEDIQEDKEKLESGFTGKGGEYLVCSELLFRGFNASIMSVDVGLDIVATKDNKMFGIQVKTSNLNTFKTYVFDIRKASLERHNTGNIFYIFVLHGDNENNFLILPYFEIEKLVDEKIILEVGHGKRYRVNIKFRNGRVYLGVKDNDMKYFLNNWELIK